MSFPILNAGDDNRLLRGGEEFVTAFGLKVRDPSDYESGGLAKVLQIDSRAETEFDRHTAYKVLLENYSGDFLQTKPNIDMSLFQEIKTYEEKLASPYDPYEEDYDPEDEEIRLINRIEANIYKLKTAARKTRRQQLKALYNV